MFGNLTEQSTPPEGVEENGFLALAEFDKVENGGNADNKIDSSDIMFAPLRFMAGLESVTGFLRAMS